MAAGRLADLLSAYVPAVGRRQREQCGPAAAGERVADAEPARDASRSGDVVTGPAAADEGGAGTEQGGAEPEDAGGGAATALGGGARGLCPECSSSCRGSTTAPLVACVPFQAASLYRS